MRESKLFLQMPVLRMRMTVLDLLAHLQISLVNQRF